MLFNLTSTVDWRVLTARKQRQIDIDNVRKNSRKFRHDYTIGNLVYVKNTSIYRKSDNEKQGPYVITEVFTNGTVRVQRVAIKNE